MLQQRNSADRGYVGRKDKAMEACDAREGVTLAHIDIRHIVYLYIHKIH